MPWKISRSGDEFATGDLRVARARAAWGGAEITNPTFYCRDQASKKGDDTFLTSDPRTGHRVGSFVIISKVRLPVATSRGLVQSEASIQVT